MLKGGYSFFIALKYLKPHCHNVTGNGKRDGAKAEKSMRMTYAEIKNHIVVAYYMMLRVVYNGCLAANMLSHFFVICVTFND